jgi:hypothetical protein
MPGKQGRQPTHQSVYRTRKRIAERVAIIASAARGRKALPAEIIADLGIPERTWFHCLKGRTMPAQALLAIMARYNVEPAFLQYGELPMFRPAPPTIEVVGAHAELPTVVAEPKRRRTG